MANMPFLDSIVGKNFRSEKAGRIVILGTRPLRCFVVRSEAEELKIRSFLKMFYFALFAIFFLGSLLSNQLAVKIYNASLDSYAHLLRALGLCVAIYSGILALPLLLLWRSYKKSFLYFVSDQDEVSVSGELLATARNTRRIWMALLAIGLIVLALFILAARVLLVHST
jgi:hypothetical protein